MEMCKCGGYRIKLSEGRRGCTKTYGLLLLKEYEGPCVCPPL